MNRTLDSIGRLNKLGIVGLLIVAKNIKKYSSRQVSIIKDLIRTGLLLGELHE